MVINTKFLYMRYFSKLCFILVINIHFEQMKEVLHGRSMFADIPN